MDDKELLTAIEENVRDGNLELVLIDGVRKYRITHKGKIYAENILVQRGINPSEMTDAVVSKLIGLDQIKSIKKKLDEGESSPDK